MIKKFRCAGLTVKRPYKKLEAMREDLPRFGVQCDALTGDGFLARPTDESASPIPVVLQALEARVLNKTGVAVSIGGKTLRGEPADSWPVSRCAQTSPGRGHQLPQPWTG